MSNDARYPIAIQIRLALRAGWTPKEVEEIRRDIFDNDQKLAWLLRLVREAAEETGRVSDGTWNSAAEAGWTTSQLAEAFANVAFATMVDAFARFAEPEFDVPEQASAENVRTE